MRWWRSASSLPPTLRRPRLIGITGGVDSPVGCAMQGSSIGPSSRGTFDYSARNVCGGATARVVRAGVISPPPQKYVVPPPPEGAYVTRDALRAGVRVWPSPGTQEALRLRALGMTPPVDSVAGEPPPVAPVNTDPLAYARALELDVLRCMEGTAGAEAHRDSTDQAVRQELMLAAVLRVQRRQR